MAESTTPEWLVETQNKSWEPEIIVSGITLTFLFLLPTHVFNFFGMLVQDHGVWQVIARMLYIVSMTILTGLKIVLIAHLVLRGLWTGFVGLSYVFPHGVVRENLPKKQRDVPYESPESIVIRIEKVCSLLFSFIFSSLMFVLGLLLLFVPITLLFFTGLDMNTIRTVTLFGVLPGVLLAVLVLGILLETRLKSSKLRARIEMLSLQQIMAIYTTNIGRARTFAIFVVYFAVVLAFSYGDISRFGFRNDRRVAGPSNPGVVTAPRDGYEDAREPRRRVSRATLSTLRTAEDRLALFVAYYREDEYTLTVLSRDPALREKTGVTPGDDLWVHDLHTVSIDGTVLPDLDWVFTEHPTTGQPGFTATIPVSSLTPGFHTITVEKHLWDVTEKELLDIDPWASLPFERVPAA